MSENKLCVCFLIALSIHITISTYAASVPHAVLLFKQFVDLIYTHLNRETIFSLVSVSAIIINMFGASIPCSVRWFFSVLCYA